MELFVTVRGFSLASAWPEKFKQQIKKPTKVQKAYIERFTVLHTRINTVFYRNYVPVNL